MKRKVIVFCALIIVGLILFPKDIYGYTERTDSTGGLILENDDLEKEKEKMQNASTEYYPYGENYATAKFKVTKKKNESGGVTYLLGEGENTIEWKQSGYSIFDKNENSTDEAEWYVWLDISYEFNVNTTDKYDVKAGNCYSDEDGDFNPEEDGWEGTKKSDKAVKTAAKKVTGALKTILGAIEGLNEIKENFQHNAVGTFITLGLDLIRAVFGDFPQFIANTIQMATDNTLYKWQYMYTKDELAEDGDGDMNKYTQVGDYTEGKGQDWQQIIDIEKEDDDDKRFAEDTKIPVMIGDLYNVAVGHISILDVNFLTGNEDHEEGSPWTIMRNFAASLIHIAIYIASAILLVSLIIFGIQIVTKSFDDPEGEAEVKTKLEKFTTSVALLIGSVIIMALCIFGSDSFFKSVENRESFELPIRVNVETAGYSFSTTAAGYVRYVAGLEDVDEWVEKGFFTFGFIILAWVNLAAIVVMLIRMIALWILSMIGPIAAALQVLNIEAIMSFKKWVGLYVGLSLIQVFLSMLYTLILNYAI